MNAKSPDARARYARAGLQGPCDPEVQALLLRQLYLGELERERLVEARAIAEQILDLTPEKSPLADVAHHDAARVSQALGDFDASVEHLRRAAALGPIERRSFHLSTMAGLLYAIGRAHEALIPLQRALEMPGSSTLILRGQLALSKHAVGDSTRGREAAQAAYDALVNDASGEGYGRFILGELAFVLGNRSAANKHLEGFVVRAKSARPAARIALMQEITKAEATIARMTFN
jgi:tetratricopeptide (TPR) repeat protein